jgi:hypothetical protein
MDKNQKTLSEKEEMLLSKYFDEECNFFERYRVYRLVEKSRSAITYLESLESTRRILRENFDFAPVALWSRISSRLHQEDKSLLLSGGRRNRGRVGLHSILDVIPSFAKYGISGAVMALLLFMIVPHEKTSSFVKFNPQGSSLISFGSSVNRIPTAMEVDWMRSNNGRRVTVMPSEQGSAPVIYVKRKSSRLTTMPILERNTHGIVMKDR